MNKNIPGMALIPTQGNAFSMIQAKVWWINHFSGVSLDPGCEWNAMKCTATAHHYREEFSAGKYSPTVRAARSKAPGSPIESNKRSKASLDSLRIAGCCKNWSAFSAI